MLEIAAKVFMYSKVFEFAIGVIFTIFLGFLIILKKFK
jgi:hypothetical protein